MYTQQVAPEARQARPAARARRWAWPVPALLGLLLIAGALRLNNLNWDQYQHIHPDERFIVWVADTIHWPGSLGAALNPATSPLNPFRWPPDSGDLAGQPRNYAYGHLPLYVLVIVSHTAQLTASALFRAGLPLPESALHLAGYAYLAPVGRVVSTAADLGTILLIYALARRMYRHLSLRRETAALPPPPAGEGGRGGEVAARRGEAVGLLAAAFYALAVLPIQLSHFYAVDVVLTFFVTAAVAVAARGAETGEGWTWPTAGALAGLAIGSKFSAFLLAAPLIAAALFGLPEEAANEEGHSAPAPGHLSPLWRALAFRLLTLAGAGLVAFLLTNPFVVLDFRSFLRQLTAQNAMLTGRMDAPYTRQYIGTTPYAYFVQQLAQWGLGWPLGLLAWGGLVWSAITAARRRGTPAQVVVLAWAWPYFALTGAMYAKFLRYMLPLLPFLMAFAAGAAFAGARWLRRFGRRGVAIAWAAGLVVALLTAGWALAFSGVYSQQHPWIAASTWIYRNIPENSKLLSEQWDDTLPLYMDELPGRPPRRTYRQVQLPLFDPDTPAKLDRLASELSSADYVVLASPRLSRPIQALPRRYPMSSQYYRMLADGELGYRLVAEFTAYPRIGRLVIPDGNADESFSVYDHPRVRIYVNAAHIASGLLRTRLGRYLPLPAGASDASPNLRGFGKPDERAATAPKGGAKGRPYDGMPQEAKQASSTVIAARPPGLAVPVRYTPPEAQGGEAEVTTQDPAGMDDFRWNRFAAEWPPVAAFLWWLVVGLFGWCAWPLLFPVLGGLRDRGYGIARLIGWLLVGWVHWIGASLGWWTNSTMLIALLLAALAAAGLLAAWRQREVLRVFSRERRRLLLAEEAVFAAAFLGFIGIRLLNPDLWQPWNGGEKFMEFAFLNATLRSPHFPPYDPYFAGGTINYYYYGLYLVGLPIKLTGIPPEIAFNLAVPGLFALAAMALFSVGASLAPRGSAGLRRGLLTVLLALLLGNLASFTQVLSALSKIGGPGPAPAARGLGMLLAGAAWPGFDYWSVSRVIPFTINEFPFWSFLFADLHPHLIAMPVGVAGIALALNWLMVGERRRAESPTEQGSSSTPALKGLAERTKPDESGWADEPISARRASFSQPGPSGPGLTADAAPGASFPEIDHSGLTADADPRASFPEIDHSGVTADAAPGASFPEPGEPGSTAKDALVESSSARWDGIEDEGSIADDGDAFLSQPGQPELDDRFNPPPGKGWPTVLAATAARVALFAIVLGALGPTNTWDLPVYLLLAAGAFLLAAWRSRRWLPVLAAPALAALTGALAWLAYLPFYQHYRLEVGGTGNLISRYLAFTHNSSPLRPWLTVWGVSLFIAYSFLLWMLWHRGSPLAGRGRVIAVLAAIGVALLLFMLDRATAGLVAWPLTLALIVALRRDVAPADVFAMLLLVLGLGIVGGIELLNLRDFLEGGDWYRMNTVFKFGIPSWLALGLAGSLALPALWGAAARGGRWPGVAWRVAAVGLVAAGLFFLPFGIPARVSDRFPGPQPALGTLDGTAYMTVGRYNWPDDRHTILLAYDYQAIHWLLDHVSTEDGSGGIPVVAEAPAGDYQVAGSPVAYDYYRAGGLRVASLTGLPTFVGQHQFEQRDARAVYERMGIGQQFFRTTDQAAALNIIKDLGIEYIYVGQLERLLFTPQSLAKFDNMASAGQLRVAYRNPQVVIYRVF